MRGQDVVAETTLTLEESYYGTTRIIRIHDKQVRVNIKPGIHDNQTLKLNGKGVPGSGDGQPGDLFLKIRVNPHPVYIRDGNDLYRDVQVDLYTAVAGGKMEIDTLKGKVKVDIPKRIQSGKVLRLPKFGMPVHNKPGEYGNLYLKLHIELPKDLKEEDVKQFKK